MNLWRWQRNVYRKALYFSVMKVKKTTFDEEQNAKDEAFLKLTPLERLEQANRFRMKMRKPGINYSYVGMKVRIKKLL